MDALLITRFSAELREVSERAVAAVGPEKIYLMAITVTRSDTESIFNASCINRDFAEHCYLLVLLEDRAQCNGATEKVENACNTHLPVTALTLPLSQFNEWRREGHPFVHYIDAKAILLHNAGTSLDELVPVDNNHLQKINEIIYTRGLNKAREFLAGAELFRIREQNRMAAFMLHQSAEQALLTIFKLRTGLTIHTHNLDKLIRYCSMVTASVRALFPRNNERNRSLFQSLNRAYVEARYKDDYALSATDLIILLNKVSQLQSILKQEYTAFHSKNNIYR